MADDLKATLLQRAPTPARGTAFENPITYGLKNIVSGGGYAKYLQQHDIYHPKDIREGVIEKLVKGLGSGFGDLAVDDLPFLEQYFHPEKDILPKTNLRPTQAKPRDMEYRSIPDSMFNTAAVRKYPDFMESFLLKKNPENVIEREPTLGLGKFTTSEAPDYYSMYDVWDFNTPSSLLRYKYGDNDQTNLNALSKMIMQRVGQPFAVYNRINKTDPRLEIQDRTSVDPEVANLFQNK